MIWKGKRIGRVSKPSVECGAAFLSHSSCLISRNKKFRETFIMGFKYRVNSSILTTMTTNNRPQTCCNKSTTRTLVKTWFMNRLRSRKANHHRDCKRNKSRQNCRLDSKVLFLSMTVAIPLIIIKNDYYISWL